jgi:hypothetical protein
MAFIDGSIGTHDVTGDHHIFLFSEIFYTGLHDKWYQRLT